MSVTMTDDAGYLAPQVDSEGNLYLNGERLYTLPEACDLRNVKIGTLEYYLRKPGAPTIYQNIRGYRYITLAEMDKLVARLTALRPISMVKDDPDTSDK
jgi:hypothetical protein